MHNAQILNAPGQIEGQLMVDADDIDYGEEEEEYEMEENEVSMLKSMWQLYLGDGCHGQELRSFSGLIHTVLISLQWQKSFARMKEFL